MKQKNMVTVGVLVLAVTAVPVFLMSKSKEAAEVNPNLNLNFENNPLAQHAKNGIGVLKSAVKDGVQPSASLSSVGGGTGGVAPRWGANAAPQQQTVRCNSNYADCVPVAEDVDCEGSNDDGPKFVKGPIKVEGNDIYGLDADGDGWACKSARDKASSKKNALITNEQETMDCFSTFCLTDNGTIAIPTPE